MKPQAKMNEIKGLWSKITRFVEALESMDDPIGDYVFSLGKRVEKLERDLDRLKNHAASPLSHAQSLSAEASQSAETH